MFVVQVVVIKGHDGLVKGVTWDPVGKYLASQVKAFLKISYSAEFYGCKRKIIKNKIEQF